MANKGKAAGKKAAAAGKPDDSRAGKRRDSIPAELKDWLVIKAEKARTVELVRKALCVFWRDACD